ncbi:MAG: hypothetical protein JWR19_3904 [Pedosphaera sp.]|nr:hypothetical protein [Pedosphaera sp.]
MLLGIVIGFYLHDFRSKPPVLPNQTAPEADRGQSPRPSDVVTDQRGPINSSQLVGADFSVSETLTALGRLKDISDMHERMSQFGVLMRRWLERDGRGAFAYVNAMEEGEMKMQGMTLVVEVLAHSDPQFLAQQTLAMPSSRSSRELIRGLAGIWSQTDVQRALAWAGQLPEGMDKNDALLSIRSQWATQDPEAVSAQISQLPENSSTAGLITTVAERWGSSNPTKALEWAKTLPETEKTLAMSSLVGVWAQRDPWAAGNFAAQLPPGETQNEAIKSVISSWAGQSPAQTAAWVLQFPAGALQDQGIRQVVSAWNNLDPEGVQNWAMNLPAGKTRDAALKNFAQTIAYWTPEKAAGIVGLINDPSEQEQSMNDIMRSWSEMDPTSARNWLAGLNMPEELKARVQSALPMK